MVWYLGHLHWEHLHVDLFVIFYLVLLQKTEFSSLHCTLLTLLSLRSPCDFTSHRVHWTWLGLMPRPLLLSTSICLMDHGGLDRGICLLPTIHTPCHTHWMCYNSVTLHSVHMTSIVLSIRGEGSSSVALPKVSSIFFISREFSSSDVRSKVRDVVCVQTVKTSEENM